MTMRTPTLVWRCVRALRYLRNHCNKVPRIPYELRRTKSFFMADTIESPAKVNVGCCHMMSKLY